MTPKKQHWSAGVILLAFVGCLTVAAQQAAPQPPEHSGLAPAAPVGSFPLSLDKPLEMAVESPGVEWRGNTYHLVQLGRAQFHLSALSRLTATFSGGVNTFDDVDYDVHVAVFNAHGQLLGTGRTVCSVARIWAGLSGTTSKTLDVDLGVNRDYAQAEFFSVAISNTQVLTPDQWQKQK
ncbi:MAG: hypothetical protein JO316_26275 [Abitibacteriaceae bacterium]|nr:hypothetical protein [Abditibacteriaceae bacterium]